MRESNCRLYLTEVDGVLCRVLCIGVCLVNFEFFLYSVLAVVKRYLINCKDTVLSSGLDGHVSHTQSVLHAEVYKSFTGELHRLVQSAVNTYHSDDVEYNVLSGAPLGKLAYDIELDCLGYLEPCLALSHACAHIGRADTCRECTESAVCTGM